MSLPAGCLALAAWISCRPYVTWPHIRVWMVVSGLLALAALLHPRVLGRLPALRGADLLALVSLGAFLVYATALPQVGGGHVAWIYALPFAAAVILQVPGERAEALRAFELLLALSLIPGLVWLGALVAGVPLTTDTMPVPNAAFADAGVRLLRFPGAVFIETNSVPLPWGGILTRLCGMFDEPGRVGTLAGLTLAAGRFDLRSLGARILFVAGLCSFSLAFLVLCGIGLAVNVALLRRHALIGPLLLLVPVAMLATGVVRVPRPREPVTAVSVRSHPPGPSTGTTRSETRPLDLRELRQTRMLDNRAMPGMKKLFRAYLVSPWPQRLIGFGSDASWVHSPISASWTSWLTNFGALGFTLLAVAFAGHGVWSLAHAGWAVQPVLYLGLFLLSAYQHPVIWVPYSLLLYFGGVSTTAAAPQGG